jgi:hypothetical protein
MSLAMENMWEIHLTKFGLMQLEKGQIARGDGEGKSKSNTKNCK